MTSTRNLPQPGTLKRLLTDHPYFPEWDDARFKTAAPHCQLLEVDAGAEILAVGEMSPFACFLLEGAVGLRPAEGEARQLSAADHDARFPFAHLRPSVYGVVATEPARILKIESAQLRRLPGEADKARYRVPERASAGSWQSHPLVVDVLNQLREGTLAVPPLPGIALKVRRALQRDDVDMADVAAIVSADPAIAGRLIKVANSAVFGGQAAVDTVQNALVRLGMTRAQNIVVTLATKGLYVARSPFVKAELLNRWRHAIDIAALCAVLGKITPTLDGDVGLLVGLLHDIGAVPILVQAERYPELEATPGLLEEILEGLMPEVSGRVLQSWEFGEEFNLAVVDQDNWFRDHDGDADYTDTLIVAHLHALVKQREFKRLPRLDETPAFQKLAAGLLSPQLSLLVLDEAHNQISELRSLLS